MTIAHPPAGAAQAGGLHRFEGRCMGSRLVLQVAGASASDAMRAWHIASNDMAASDASLSRFRADSDLSRLNAEAGSGTLRKVEPRLRMMLTLARRAQRQTSGRFDARTLEVLEGLGERAQVPYAPGLVPRIAGDAGWMRRTGRDLVSLDTAIDSGGLGKGLGLRWALAAALRGTSRLTGLLLEAGGDVAAIGGPVPGGAWQVGIEDPAEPAQVLAVVTLRDAALATSSTSVRRWTGPTGQPVHHLIDPSTWQPADGGLLAVTVVHTDPAWAEIWSKAYFIAGAAAIGPEARARGMAVWWVEGDRSFHLTPAAREHTEWLRDD